MKANSFSSYPTIGAADLAPLTLDSASAQRFDRRFRSPELSVAFLVFITFVGSYLLYHRGMLGGEACVGVMFGVGLPALVVLFTMERWRLQARPLCLQSGREMEPHVVEGREGADLIEIAYIDRSCGRYFTRSFAL